ncbi:MAG: hypothetical protein R3C16_00385 [Hyphomonadaceae bacterium]
MNEARRPTTTPSASTTIQPLVTSEALAERVDCVRIGSCPDEIEGARVVERDFGVKRAYYLTLLQ